MSASDAFAEPHHPAMDAIDDEDVVALIRPARRLGLTVLERWPLIWALRLPVILFSAFAASLLGLVVGLLIPRESASATEPGLSSDTDTWFFGVIWLYFILFASGWWIIAIGKTRHAAQQSRTLPLVGTAVAGACLVVASGFPMIFLYYGKSTSTPYLDAFDARSSPTFWLGVLAIVILVGSCVTSSVFLHQRALVIGLLSFAALAAVGVLLWNGSRPVAAIYCALVVIGVTCCAMLIRLSGRRQGRTAVSLVIAIFVIPVVPFVALSLFLESTASWAGAGGAVVIAGTQFLVVLPAARRRMQMIYNLPGSGEGFFATL